MDCPFSGPARKLLAARLSVEFAVLKFEFSGIRAGGGEAQLVFLAVRLRVYRAERFEEINEADVGLAVDFRQRDRVRGLGRVNRELPGRGRLG